MQLLALRLWLFQARPHWSTKWIRKLTTPFWSMRHFRNILDFEIVSVDIITDCASVSQRPALTSERSENVAICTSNFFKMFSSTFANALKKLSIQHCWNDATWCSIAHYCLLIHKNNPARSKSNWIIIPSYWINIII